jgi:GLPGLI family protein
MKNVHLSLIIVFLFLSVGAQAQFARFLESGQITFEKRTNAHALTKKAYANVRDQLTLQIIEQNMKNTPQFTTEEFSLQFGEQKSVYRFVRKTSEEGYSIVPVMLGSNASERTNYFDFEQNLQVSQRTFRENPYLIKDLPMQIDWKITDETREIAGFLCRRANALIYDSVYVVAFYTDRILVEGGPEIYTGLPGMILGLALPHDHVTWFATKVEDKPVTIAPLAVPKKGKELTWEGMREEVLKAYGKNTSEKVINNLIKQLQM